MFLCFEKNSWKMGSQKRKEPCYYSAVMSKQMGMAAGRKSFGQDFCITPRESLVMWTAESFGKSSSKFLKSVFPKC